MINRIADYFRNRSVAGRTPTERVMNTIKSASRWMRKDPAWMVRVLQDQRSELLRIRNNNAAIAEMAKSDGWQQVEDRLITMIRALNGAYIQYGGSNKDLALVNWMLARSYTNLIAMVAGPEREHDVAEQLLQENTMQMLKSILGQPASKTETEVPEN